jgi:hypothetical protein
MPAMDVYADESGTNAVPYLLIGGIWVNASTAQQLRAGVAAAKAARHATHVLKWENITSRHLGCHKAVVDCLFDHPDARFECIVIDKSKVLNALKHGGSKDLGFMKFYYLLLSRRIVLGTDYFVTVDRRRSSVPNSLTTLKNTCNNWIRKEHGQQYGDHVHRIVPKAIKDEPILEITDIILGAVSASYQPNHTIVEKDAMISHVCMRANLSRLNRGTYPPGQKVNIWELRL